MNVVRTQEVNAPKPVLTIAALAAAMLFPPVFVAWDFAQAWTPLEREYIFTYLNTARGGSGKARLLLVDYGSHRRLLADDADVTPSPDSETGYNLTRSARARDAQTLEWVEAGDINYTRLHDQLRQVIYGGQNLHDLTRVPGFFGLGMMFLVPFALWLDWSEVRELRAGRVRQGPRHVDRFNFNRLKRSSGLGFETADSPTIRERIAEQRERLAKRPPGPRAIRLSRVDEEQHILFLGDAGTGKSSLIRQLIPQIRARGETAVIYDPALEFTPQFYDPDQGDFLLNPVDTRMPYWTPADEIRFAPESLTLARALFPDLPQDDPEAVGTARSIFGWLIFRERPTPQQVATWMSHFEEIDQLVAGTPLAGHLSPDRVEQRARVRSLFSRAATAFHLVPPESQTTRRWSAASWSLERDGWLFLPGRPEIRDSLRPLVSFWLDALLVRLVNSGEAGARPVWLILDSLETLQRLPQLPMALSDGRKANLRVVIAARSPAGIQAKYGEDAEAILTSPMTKVFLRTSEPRCAEWVSGAIGNIEVEYLRDAEPTVTYSASGKRRFYHLDRSIEPLVSDSAIQNLSNLSGYLKSRNLVVPMRFAWPPPERKQPGFLPRAIDTLLPVIKSKTASALSTGQQTLTTSEPPSNNRAPRERQEKETTPQAIFD